MLFTFHRIGWEDDSKHSGWWLYIDTIEQLQAYFQYNAYEIAQVWLDVKQSPEVKSCHCRTRKADCMKELLAIKLERERRTRMSMPEAVNFIENEFNSAKIKIFYAEGAIYVNSAGGCRGPHLRNDHRGVDEHIYEVHENENLVFPLGDVYDIRITRWPGCKHFYLSVNGKSTEVDGVGKWNTIEAAEDAKQLCMDRLKKKSKYKKNGFVKR